MKSTTDEIGDRKRESCKRKTQDDNMCMKEEELRIFELAS
jgi:hypothetical protein